MLLQPEMIGQCLRFFAVRAGHHFGVLYAVGSEHVFVSLQPLSIQLIVPLVLIDHAVGHQDLNVFKEPLAVGKAIVGVKRVVEKAAEVGRAQILYPGHRAVEPGYVSDPGNEDLLAVSLGKHLVQGIK